MGSSGRLPDIYYEQYVLGELDEATRARVEAAPDFDARIAEIKESDGDILETYPPEAFATRIRNAYEASRAAQPQRRVSENRRQARTGGILAGSLFGRPVASFGVSAAVLAIVAVAAVMVGGLLPQPGEGIRTKGLEAEIRVYRDGGEAIEILQDGSQVAEGDLLQISYNAAGGRFGCIFSIDGRGAFTLHYPPTADGATSIEPSGEVLLPYAYRLDDAPRFEKFYFVTSDQEFDLDTIFDVVSNQIDRQAEEPGYDLRFTDAGAGLPELTVSSLILRKAE